MSSMPQQLRLLQPGASRRTVARSVTCRHCETKCLVAACFDGRWRIFDRAFHTGDAPAGTRWWLTRSGWMVHDAVADGCPTRWVAQHFCRDSAMLGGLFAGIVSILDGDEDQS